MSSLQSPQPRKAPPQFPPTPPGSNLADLLGHAKLLQKRKYDAKNMHISDPNRDRLIAAFEKEETKAWAAYGKACATVLGNEEAAAAVAVMNPRPANNTRPNRNITPNPSTSKTTANCQQEQEEDREVDPVSPVVKNKKMREESGSEIAGAAAQEPIVTRKRTVTPKPTASKTTTKNEATTKRQREDVALQESPTHDPPTKKVKEEGRKKSASTSSSATS